MNQPQPDKANTASEVAKAIEHARKQFAALNERMAHSAPRYSQDGVALEGNFTVASYVKGLKEVIEALDAIEGISRRLGG